TVHVLSESELSLRAGMFFSEDTNFRIGGNLRFVRSEYLRNQFLLIDALADPDSLEIKKENRLYFDPGVTYTWESEWQPMLSVALSNFAIFRDGKDKDDSVSAEIGYATTPNILSKKLRTSVHITTRSDV